MTVRGWSLGWLAAAVLFAQLMLAVHGVGHAFEHDAAVSGEVCVECLALSGTHGTPPPAVTISVPLDTAAIAPAHAVLPAPTTAFLPAYRSRAPPLLQNR